MAKPILIANWKNFPGSLKEAEFLLKELGKRRHLYKKTILSIAPPLPYLEVASERIKGFAMLGVQDAPLVDRGVHTGEVTPEIIKSFGVKLAILGHSERRAMGETSSTIWKKIRVALKAGLAPVLCVGELSRDAEGEHFEYLRQELKSLLHGLSRVEAKKIVIAYEPVWAVGKDALDVIEPVELTQTILFIRKALSDLFGRETAEVMPILYGGSVDAVNAGFLMRNTGIRGFLVGRASLNAKSLSQIAESVLER